MTKEPFELIINGVNVRITHFTTQFNNDKWTLDWNIDTSDHQWKDFESVGELWYFLYNRLKKPKYQIDDRVRTYDEKHEVWICGYIRDIKFMDNSFYYKIDSDINFFNEKFIEKY